MKIFINWLWELSYGFHDEKQALKKVADLSFKNKYTLTNNQPEYARRMRESFH
jgi:hypothetical protein